VLSRAIGSLCSFRVIVDRASRVVAAAPGFRGARPEVVQVCSVPCLARQVVWSSGDGGGGR